jgi:Ca2+-transporting ATPase
MPLADEFDINTAKGLSGVEATAILKDVGYNELPSAKPRSILAIAFEVIKEPMFLLLVAGGLVYLMLGELQEALMLLGFVFVVMGITFYQERKTERALEALRDLSSPRALVIREGIEKRIAGRDVVPGDLIILSEGDRVPADAILLSCTNLSADESLLTGESVSVRKICSNDAEKGTKMGRPGGDDLPFVYSGSLIVQGQGVVEVRATGINTEIGRIGRALREVEPEETALHKETYLLVRNLAITGLILCALVIIAYGTIRNSWLQGFLAGITTAMALLPEEFPVVLTVFLALGAWRISQSSVLTRRVPALETLGSATVLCVDKTGTLTMNRMKVKKVFANGEFYELNDFKSYLPESIHKVVEFSILASQIDPFDPMEKAFKKLGEDYLAKTEHIHKDWELVKEYPLSKMLLAMSRVWRSPSGKNYVIAAKGAPEAIADLCHIDMNRKLELSMAVQAMANEGLRVLAVAAASFQETELPDIQHDFEFKFLGLMGMEDPVRPGVPEAIKECHSAGIRVVMITGDYPGTAQAIARQIGLPYDQVITGPELERLNDQELQRHVREISIFSRVVPEQKLRLVQAFKANSEVVAMTGDGVNDAPALKAANIGIAMGGRGTDVAREAASLVLLNDDFLSIVKAVRLGRRIFDNIKKAMAYILAVHVPIAGMSLIPILLGLPLVFFPVQVVFLELIIDPACSVAFEAEPEEADVMNRPPRIPNKPLFSRSMLGLSLLQGLIVLIIVLAVFATSIYRGQEEADVRALTLVIYVPFLRELFGFAYLHFIDIAICFMAGIISILWFEGLKAINGSIR